MLTDEEIDFYLKNNKQEDNPAHWQALTDLLQTRQDLRELCEELFKYETHTEQFSRLRDHIQKKYGWREP